MDAIKAAKEKAEYLLGAINERAGEPVWVKDVEDAAPTYALSNINSNTSANFVRRTAYTSDDDYPLDFTPIRLRYVIQAKFEIE